MSDDTSESVPTAVMKTKQPLSKLIQQCAEGGFVQVGRHVLSSGTLVKALLDPESAERVVTALPHHHKKDLSVMMQPLNDAAKSIQEIDVSDIEGDWTERVADWLTSPLDKLDRKLGMMRRCVVIVLNRFDEPLKLVKENTTWNGGSHSGFQSNHPGVLTDKTGVFVSENEVPAATNKGTHYSTLEAGLGSFSFRRKPLGFVGVEGAMNLTCDSPGLENGLTIGFVLGIDNQLAVAVSVNSTDLNGFNDRYLGDLEGDRLTDHSTNKTACAYASIMPVGGMFTGVDTDYQSLVVTVSVCPPDVLANDHVVTLEL